ncbi:MAG: amidohydrolase [bacterium]|nr:amidohydrolase [bacterium]
MENASSANVPEHCDLLLEAGTLVTLDPSRPVIECGSVAIVGERIVAVGPQDVVSVYRADRVISCRGRLVMPGLVDCHNHLFQSLGRTLGEGLPGWEWLSRFMWPYAAEITPEETRAAVYLGAVEAALAGTTALLDHHYGRTDYDTTLAVASAIEEVGLRGVVARGMAGGYTPLAERQGLPEKAFPLSDTEELYITEACLEAQPPGSRVAVWPGPINAVYTDQRLLVSAVRLARSYGTGWHTHLSAPQGDPDVYREAYGVRPATWLHNEGLLGPEAVLAHATWLDGAEIEAIGSTRTAVVHCPMSNQYVPYGVMPMRQLLDAGATVGLGTDGSTCGHRQDLFENMKMLVLMHRLADLDPGASSAAEALRVATAGGAGALGLEAGRLVPGALADVIVLDTSRAHLTPIHDPLSALVYAARGSDVTMNIVGGQVIVEDGLCTRVDQDEVMSEARARARYLLGRIGLG